MRTAPRASEVVRVGEWSFGTHLSGAGAPVVLLHGLLTDSRVWQPVTVSLERDHMTLAVDAPGHGLSPVRRDPYTLDEEVSALAELARKTFDGRPAVWIGHSMGGMKALRMALAHPELVRALVLVSTQPYAEPEHSARPYEAMVETVVTHGMSADLAAVIGRMNFHRDFLSTAAAGRWVRHFGALTGEQIEQPCYSVYRRGDISGRLGEIRVPTLVVHGADDVPIRVRVAREYVTHLPHGRLVELPGTGHTPPCERPAELARLIREFLDDQRD